MPEIPRFAGAPEELRSEQAIADQRAAVTVQINEWIRKIREPAGIRPLLAIGNAVLHERRSGRSVVQFTEDRDALVVTDRVVVPADQFEAARDAVSGAGQVDEIPTPGLAGIRVLRCADIGRRKAEGLGLEGLAADEVPGEPIHLVPMGGIRKAEGGPELSGPADGERPWTRREPTTGPHGPRVAVLDTGITAEERADGWLTGLVTDENEDLLDVYDPIGRLDLGAGHGTFVTGVIQQVAPEADISVVKVLDSDGLGDEVAIAAAIVKAAADGAQIINLSLGTTTADGTPPLVLMSALRSAIALRKDILFVCAAGNFGDSRACWPGAFSGMAEFRDNVVSVAGLRIDDEVAGQYVGAEWSSRGDWVTCSTPAQGVVSTYVEGEEMDQPPPLRRDKFGKAAWATWTGTSFAAPQVVGAIVWTMQQDGWQGTPMQAFRKVMEDGADVVAGYGTSISILPV
jgi:hypothetical protein